jgi:translation initiation factor 1
MRPRRRLDLGDLVFDSEHGRMCPGCDRPLEQCACGKEAERVPETDGIVRVSRQTQGRKGKGVTVVTGVPLVPSELKRLAKAHKQRCGSGGAVKDGAIEIQGDHRDLLVDELTKRGFTVKRVGG